eukprot:3851690-Prymnesium_polylepis.2
MYSYPPRALVWQNDQKRTRRFADFCRCWPWAGVRARANVRLYASTTNVALPLVLYLPGYGASARRALPTTLGCAATWSSMDLQLCLPKAAVMRYRPAPLAGMGQLGGRVGDASSVSSSYTYDGDSLSYDSGVRQCTSGLQHSSTVDRRTSTSTTRTPS